MYYLGIDGGGTKTKVFVIDESEQILYEGDGGPSSIDTVSKDETIKSINDATNNFFNNHPNAKFKTVFAGLGGVPDEASQDKLYQILLEINGVDKSSNIIARSDMENALASGLCFDEGITLIAGTGMVAYGKNQQGLTARAGGLGYKEGDLGSSYSLGFMALQMVARTLDGRYEPTLMTISLSKDLNLTTPAEVANLFEKWHTERTLVASLAPYVTKYANLGDHLAIKIADKMAYELALSVDAVDKKLQIPKPTLVVVGTLGNIDGYFKNKLHEIILSNNQNIKIISPIVDPGYAAALLALKANKK